MIDRKLPVGLLLSCGLGAIVTSLILGGPGSLTWEVVFFLATGVIVFAGKGLRRLWIRQMASRIRRGGPRRTRP